MMGRKVLAAKSGRAACSCTAAGGGIAAKNAKSFSTGFTGLREVSVKAAKTKPSGVEWIGDIPEGWEVGKLGSLYTHRNEKVSDKVYPPLSVTMKGIVPQLATAAKSDDGDNRKLVRKGDFAINSRSDRRGSCGISEFDGSVSLINTILTPRGKMNPVYYNWLFHTEAFADEFYKWGHGIVDDLWTTRWSEMKRMAIVVPPLPVQRAIASYLDEKCGAIDAAIVEAKKGIEEYKAWKKSLIFEVVTGKRRVGFFNAESKCARDEVVGLLERSESEGLQGAASRRVAEKMKPSGIPWIGDVPVGWEVSRVKHHYELILGKMLCATSNNDANVRLPYVCAANVHFEGVALSDLKEMWFSTIEVKQYAIREGDLLVVEGGAGAGGAAICPRIDGIVGIQNSIILVRNKSCRDNRYLRYLLEALVKNGYVDFVCNKATIPHFTKDKLGNVPLPLPPLPEQQAIAAYLDEKCGAIDEMVAEKEALIADLEAYKKSLIYETVTGKREVL